MSCWTRPRRGGGVASLCLTGFCNHFCRLGDGKEYLFQAKDEVRHGIFKAISWKRYKWVCRNPAPEEGSLETLFSLLRLKWAPGFVPSWAPFHQHQETHQEVHGRSAVPWPCLPSPPAPLKAEALPCATKMAKTRIARRGSASLARRNRTNSCKKLRLSEFRHSQAGRKESSTRSRKHPGGLRELVNSSLVAYGEHLFLFFTSFKCHLCFHSCILLRGTSHCKSSSS